MNQNSNEPSGSKNYPANNYIPKSNPNSRPKKFTKYAYVVKNKVAWDRMRRKYSIIEGQGQQGGRQDVQGLRIQRQSWWLGEKKVFSKVIGEMIHLFRRWWTCRWTRWRTTRSSRRRSTSPGRSPRWTRTWSGVEFGEMLDDDYLRHLLLQFYIIS